MKTQDLSVKSMKFHITIPTNTTKTLMSRNWLHLYQQVTMFICKAVLTVILEFRKLICL